MQQYSMQLWCIGVNFFKIILEVSGSQAFLDTLFCGWGGDIGEQWLQMVEEGSSVLLELLRQRAHSAPVYVWFGNLSHRRLHSDTSFLFRSWISLELL